jgi:hypothetical protein
MDDWTAAGIGYHAQTAHFLDENFVMRQVVLQCSKTTGGHGAEDVVKQCNAVRDEWGIEKEGLLVMDSCAVNPAVAMHFPSTAMCLAHRLQLIANIAFNITQRSYQTKAQLEDVARMAEHEEGGDYKENFLDRIKIPRIPADSTRGRGGRGLDGSESDEDEEIGPDEEVEYNEEDMLAAVTMPRAPMEANLGDPYAKTYSKRLTHQAVAQMVQDSEMVQDPQPDDGKGSRKRNRAKTTGSGGSRNKAQPDKQPSV